MNVFLSTYLSTTTKIFEITTGTQRDNVSMGEYTYNEAFALTLVNNGDESVERLNLNNKDNFYNLDPNCKYKITALKIGDTSLSDTDISDGDPNIPSTSTYTYINADTSKDWVKSVYKQCTGKDLPQPFTDSLTPINMDKNLQAEPRYLGQQIAEKLYEEKPVAFTLINDLIPNDDSISPFFKTLSSDKQSEFINSVEFFMSSYKKTNTTGFKDGNLVQNYFNVLKQFQDQYANDATATSILKKYDPLENDDFKEVIPNTNPDILKIIYNIDPSNTYEFTSSLNGGLAYVLWLFYTYYVMISILIGFSGFTPDDPIISTIPVSITFTNVTQ